MTTFLSISFSCCTLSLFLVAYQPQDVGVPAYRLTLEMNNSHIPGLPLIATLDFKVPPPKYPLTLDQIRKLPYDKRESAYDEISGYSVPIIDLSDSLVPVTLRATDSRGIKIAETMRPGSYVYRKPALNPNHFIDKERLVVGGMSSFRQFIDIGTFLNRSTVTEVNIQCTWYISSVVKYGVTSNLKPIRILPCSETDEQLLQDFKNQIEYKSPTRCWLKCELNYPLLRDKLSKQAKEQLVIYGFLRAIINAEKLDFAPVDWLDDAPEHLLPLALTFRLEVALAKGEKQLTEQFEKRIDKEYPGLYWEIKRIKEGKGMLITILKERLGK